jgi:hypothetical protein
VNGDRTTCSAVVITAEQFKSVCIHLYAGHGYAAALEAVQTDGLCRSAMQSVEQNFIVQPC